MRKKEELNKLLEKKKMLENISPDKQLAIYIHRNMCNKGYEKHCTWLQEGGEFATDWNELEHREYLSKAQKALRIADKDSIEKLIQILTQEHLY